MAQANIKERIKEMRLRVLAEPLGETAAQLDGNPPPKEDISQDGIKVSADNLKNDTTVREKTTQTRQAKKPKSGKKKTVKNSMKQHSEDATVILEKTPQKESNVNTNGQVEEFQNELAPDQLDEQIEEQIGEAKINPNTVPKEPSNLTEPIANDKAPDEHKKSSDKIIELTDKWVELEVRSRLSGLEKQEKQTRAMLEEIVEILDRIETTKHSKQASPPVSEKKLASTSRTSQMPRTRKRQWQDAIKRIFVVIGTFVIFAGVIWGILLYLFFDI